MTWIVYAAVTALLAGLGAASAERVLRAAGRPGRPAWIAATVLSIALPAVAVLGWTGLRPGSGLLSGVIDEPKTARVPSSRMVSIIISATEPDVFTHPG